MGGAQGGALLHLTRILLSQAYCTAAPTRPQVDNATVFKEAFNSLLALGPLRGLRPEAKTCEGGRAVTFPDSAPSPDSRHV